MHADVRKAEDVIIVDLDGHLVAGTGDEMLREIMNEILGGDWRKIVLNLSGVARIDSAGIGELVASIKLAERLGTAVRVLSPTGRVRHVLEFSQVLPLFHVCEDEDEALGSFDGEAPASPNKAAGAE